MSRRIGVPRRLATTVTWPVGVSWTAWSYIWRTTPLHRTGRRVVPGEQACNVEGQLVGGIDVRTRRVDGDVLERALT